MKSKLRILDGTGDTVLYWSVVDEQATAIAEAKFNELRSEGAQLIETDGNGGGQRNIQTFNKLAPEIVAIPSFAGG